jgi:AcrR family transcriptional regulator
MSPRPQIEHIRRPQILDAAIEVICERGLQNTRIADVAERAGTSPSAVLYWFKTKEDLLAQAMIADEERFAKEVDGRLAEIDNPAAKMLAIIDACVADNNWTMWIELWSQAISNHALRAEREVLDHRWRRTLAQVIREGVQREIFAAVNPTETALALSALIDGLAVQVTLGDPSMTRPRMRKVSTEAAERLLSVKLEQAAMAAEAKVAG